MNMEAPSGHIDPYEEAVRFIRETAAGMGLDVKVDVRHRKDESILDISGPSLGMLIGRRGQTLDALQYLTNIVANRHSDKFIRIVLDAEQFRARRQKRWRIWQIGWQTRLFVMARKWYWSQCRHRSGS